MDIHFRISSLYRHRLNERRKELGMSLNGVIADLVRRGLDAPPPGTTKGPQFRPMRDGLAEEAALACLLAVEQTRLLVEASDPSLKSEEYLEGAAVAAEQRLLTARRALGEIDR